MDDKSTLLSEKRRRVLVLLAAGYITQAEAAVQAGVTRQRIGQWVKAENLHPIAARKRHLRELMHHADL